MKNTFITILVSLVFNISFAQNMVKMKIERGTNNKELDDILNFENICLDKFEFSSKDIIGKNYEINIVEFKDGKIESTTQLFESSEIDLFKVKEKKFTFTLLTKFIDKTKLKIALKFDRFGSKTLFFDLIETKFGYTMKDFIGSKSELELPLENEFYITSIISPTMHEDGSASYCEVVKSKNPEKIGEEFKIPHYFLIKMKFKE
jgi:hypothetical protein